MTAITVTDWIPIEYDADVIQRVAAASAVLPIARHTPMGSSTKSVPRSAGTTDGYVVKGVAYGTDSETNDEVTITARKFGTDIEIADEDIDDTLPDVINAKLQGWSTSHAKLFDNASLAVTAAGSGSTGLPFNSVVYALSQNNSDTGYTANANIISSASVDYDLLSELVGKVEGGDYFDAARIVVIAHPSFRAVLRGIKDLDGQPIFVQGLAGTPDTLFGAPIRWTTGAKTSATATLSPAGKPVMVVVNADYLVVGDRTPERYQVRPGLFTSTGVATVRTDVRQAFALAHEKAAAAFIYG